jgi:hypothetical protein
MVGAGEANLVLAGHNSCSAQSTDRLTPTEIWSYRLRGKRGNGTPGSELPDRFGHPFVCLRGGRVDEPQVTAWIPSRLLWATRRRFDPSSSPSTEKTLGGDRAPRPVLNASPRTDKKSYETLSVQMLSRFIAHELVTVIKGNVSVDWMHRDSARANIRRHVKRLLRKYG